jgi:hypothetical protein
MNLSVIPHQKNLSLRVYGFKTFAKGFEQE